MSTISTMSTVSTVSTMTAASLLTTAAPARAGDWLPSEPIVAADGRLVIGGDIAATLSCAHSNLPNAASCTGDTGFFNYTDYEHSALRMFQVDLTASVRATDRIALLGEVRTENVDTVSPYGLYVRIRPWMGHNIDIQAGRVPPTFGAFARRTYVSDNPLIGYPLAYQYLTSLRPDALPASADELLKMRGRGWLSSFSVGNTTPERGMPLVSAFRWDTGVQIHAASAAAEATVAVTTGTLGDPLVGDDNAGKQLAGRVSFRPATGLLVGVSAARGPFVTQQAAAAAGVEDRSGHFTQTAWGGDVEYSRAYYLVRVEAILNDWTVPVVHAPDGELSLRAISTSVEGRYKIRPRLFAAARYDHLGFSDITGTTRTDSWDAPVTRVEVGGGYSIERNLQLKVSFQHNTRPGGRATQVDLGAAQIVFWF
jgi:hypothetical protein